MRPRCASHRAWKSAGRSDLYFGQQKNGIHILEKFSLYFTHLPRSPQWTDLHEILHGGSPRGLNHMFQILYRSVEGFRICAGSNFDILHWLSRSPLTQGCATARLWYFCTTAHRWCNVKSYHTSHDSMSVVRTTFKVYGKMQNLTLSQPKTPDPIITKFKWCDYVGDIYHQKNWAQSA